MQPFPIFLFSIPKLDLKETRRCVGNMVANVNHTWNTWSNFQEQRRQNFISSAGMLKKETEMMLTIKSSNKNSKTPRERMRLWQANTTTNKGYSRKLQPFTSYILFHFLDFYHSRQFSLTDKKRKTKH